MYHFAYPYEQIMPLLVGKNLFECIQLVSDYNLNLKIHNYKIDKELAEGTILWQSPGVGQKVKPHQTILCTLSCLPSPTQFPDFQNKNLIQIKKILKEQHITAQIHLIKKSGSSTCFAQYPAAYSSHTKKPIILYLRDPDSRKIIIPNFLQQPVSKVVNFLKQHAIDIAIVHDKKTNADHVCTTCIIKAQKPLAGSILSFSQLSSIQLQVS